MKDIFSQRLKSARLMAGYSLQSLADEMENCITKQAIHKYENGLMLPNSDILLKLASILCIKVDYFFKEKKIVLQGVEFRKQNRLSKKALNSIREKTIDYLERYLNIETLLNAELIFENPIKDLIIETGHDVETACEELRRAWKLGENPVPNVIEMLEFKGIKIFEVDISAEFDGMSAWVDTVPVLALRKDVDIVRLRFTALHELAHILLNFSTKLNEKAVEKLCHHFAGAVLLPAKSIFTELGKNRHRISLNELISIKAYFGISIQAIMARAKSLNIIGDSQYRNFNMFIRQMGYHKNEPGKYEGDERTDRFDSLVYRAASEEIISLSKASSLLNVRLADLQNNFQVI